MNDINTWTETIKSLYRYILGANVAHEISIILLDMNYRMPYLLYWKSVNDGIYQYKIYDDMVYKLQIYRYPEVYDEKSKDNSKASLWLVDRNGKIKTTIEADNTIRKCILAAIAHATCYILNEK